MRAQWQAFGVVDGYATTVFAIRDTEDAAIKDARAALGTHTAVEVHRRRTVGDDRIEFEQVHVFKAEDENRGDAA